MRTHGNKQKHENPNPIQRGLIDHFHRNLADLVREIAPGDLLDVGCGEGYTLRALVERGIHCPMRGVDLSAPAIDAARLRVPEARFEVADALDLSRAGHTCDLVLMTEVLEHIPSPARILPLLESIARRYVIVSVPWEPFFRGLNFLRGKHVTAFGNDPEHVNHWGRHSFLTFVGERFDVRRAPFVFPWTLVLAERRT
jgi:SAM-dependent methyltransferase